MYITSCLGWLVYDEDGDEPASSLYEKVVALLFAIILPLLILVIVLVIVYLQCKASFFAKMSNN